jgi:hypothetical protein
VSPPVALPNSKFVEEQFITAIADDSLVYFLLNVGDGDCQLILLPPTPTEGRRAIIVDVAAAPKLLSLIGQLESAELLKPGTTVGSWKFPLVVATHPHHDHIGGMPKFLRTWHASIAEFWHSGYFIPTGTFVNTMAELADDAGGARPLVGLPTSGTVRYYGNVGVTVLAPGVSLRNRFDTFGVEINDASISLMIEYPANRVTEDPTTATLDRRVLPRGKARRLLLGADAQHESWSQVGVDFPALHTSRSFIAQALADRGEVDDLKADVFKVPHHGSKHGTSIELVERVQPSLSLVSCVREGGSYGFPHEIALEQIREAREPTAATGKPRRPDWELGIHYTGAADDAGALLGSMAVVVPPSGALKLWRFGDGPTDAVNFAAARRWKP